MGGNNKTMQDIAFRSFSWASYSTSSDGVSEIGPNERDVWFRAQLGWMLGMAQAMRYGTSKTPPAANHLLLSLPVLDGASVPTSVSYQPNSVRWVTSGVPSTDRLR